MSVDVKYALERALGLCKLKELKEKQKEAVLAFINGNNIFNCIHSNQLWEVYYLRILPLVYGTKK